MEVGVCVHACFRGLMTNGHAIGLMPEGVADASLHALQKRV